MSAIVGKDTGATALIAAFLLTSFGLPDTIAAVIAALLIKLIVAPATDEICKAWGETLPAYPVVSANRNR